jgi:DNA-binding protein YbaB
MGDEMARLEASARARLERMHELGEGIRGIRVRQASPDGLVTAIANGNGGLLDLRLSEGISRLSPDEFSRAVLETTAAAVRHGFGAQADLIDAFNHQVEDSPHDRIE